jgi:hypothetical protein
MSLEYSVGEKRVQGRMECREWECKAHQEWGRQGCCCLERDCKVGCKEHQAPE